jgi:hypothetical protein
MSADNYDQFGDVINNQAGIFGAGQPNIGDGLHGFETPTTRVVPDGVAVEMDCRKCGSPARITLSFQEMVAVMYNIAPHFAFHGMQQQLGLPGGLTEWRYSTGQEAWFPVIACNRCGEALAPLFTPDEAEHHLRKARQNQWINPAGERHVAQVCVEAVNRLKQQRTQGY